MKVMAAPGQFRTPVRTLESQYAHSASLGRGHAAGERAVPRTRYASCLATREVGPTQDRLELPRPYSLPYRIAEG